MSIFFLSPGQMSDARGTLVLLASLPTAKRLLGDQGYGHLWMPQGVLTVGTAGVIFIQEDGGGPGVRPRKQVEDDGQE